MFKYQNHGRDGQEPSRLHHLFGQYEVNPLPYENEEELTKAMAGMNLIDIQKIASNIGLVPTGDRKKLCKAVTVKFKDFVRFCGTANQQKKEFDIKDYQ
jgi:hypothetical protein